MDIGKSQKLTVAAVLARLTTALEGLGFARVKDRSAKLVKSVNGETEVFLFLGVQRRGAEILVDPVIGVENVRLRQRLLSAGWEGSTRVCHMYLGILARWGRSVYLKTGEELDDVVAMVVSAVKEYGLPTMNEYDTFAKVKKLFEDDLANESKVAVLFAARKLKLMETH